MTAIFNSPSPWIEKVVIFTVDSLCEEQYWITILFQPNQRAYIRAEWWKDNFPTLSMFEDTFKDGIEKKIDFKGVVALIATIFQHHIPFQLNIESTILVNFN